MIWTASLLRRELRTMVTYMHSEGVAGAIAVAIAAAMAWRLRDNTSTDSVAAFFNEIHRRTPDSETRRGIGHAFQIRQVPTTSAAARMLGDGSGVTCPDTVPFAVWAAARHLHEYREAIAATASVGGDVDTNCAIVGGIVALSSGRKESPGIGWSKWRNSLAPFRNDGGRFDSTNIKIFNLFGVLLDRRCAHSLGA
jgi:ADP-ribosylglycohydrolase